MELNKAVKNIISGNNDGKRMLIKNLKNITSKLKRLLKDYSPLTLKRFKTTYSHIETFIKTDYSIYLNDNFSDIDIEDHVKHFARLNNITCFR